MTDLANVIPRENSVDAFVDNFHAALTPETPITNATFVFSLYDSDDVVVPGCDAVSMTHQATGNYRGSAVPTSALTDTARYKLVITCSNYVAKWTKYFTARNRPFTK